MTAGTASPILVAVTLKPWLGFSPSPPKPDLRPCLAWPQPETRLYRVH